MRKGRDDGLKDLESKAMSTDSDEDGGYAVPEQLDRNIIKMLTDDVVMRQVSTVIRVGTPAYKKLVDVGGIGAGWVGETDPRPATNTPKLEPVTPFWGNCTEIRSPPRRCWMTLSLTSSRSLRTI